MTRTRTLVIPVKKKTGETFDAVLNCPPKMMPDAIKDSAGSWFFSTPRGKAKLTFNENKSFGILDHKFVDDEAKWNVPMRVISSGDFSELIITLVKPDEITEQQFDQRIKEIEQVFESMKKIIEEN